MSNLCPLCNNDRFMHKKRKDKYMLYDHRLCKRCYYKFQNRRQLAFVIDFFGLYFFMLAIWLLANGFLHHEIATINTLIGSVARDPLLGLTTVLAFTLKDSIKGTSPGKLLCNVQCVNDSDNKGCGILASIKRNWIFIFMAITNWAALIPAFTMGKGKRLGDGWAKTHVIWKKHANKSVFNPQGLSSVFE